MIGTNLLIIDYQIPWDTKSVWCTSLCYYSTKSFKGYLTLTQPSKMLFFRDSRSVKWYTQHRVHWKSYKSIPVPPKANLKATFTCHLQVTPVQMKFDAMVSSPELHIPRWSIPESMKMKVCNFYSSSTEAFNIQLREMPQVCFASWRQKL